MDTLNSFDLVILLIVAIFCIKGFINGFLREVFGFLGIVFGIYFAARLSKVFLPYFSDLLHIQSENLLDLIVFIVLFVCIWILFIILGSGLSKLTKVTGFGFLNNILGFAVGGGKYFIIFAVIMTALSNVKILNSTMNGLNENSIIYQYLIATGSLFLNKSKDENEQNMSIQKMIKTENNVSVKGVRTNGTI